MIQDVINKIKDELVRAFDDLFYWFRSDDQLLDHRPSNNGWTIRQILEHISLTNHFLLILIRKGVIKSIEKTSNTDYSDLLINYDLDWEKLKVIGERRSFEWNRPEHMEPTNEIALSDVKVKLEQQLQECLSLLDQIPNGEGVLYKTMMSVNNLGKIDVYHYIYFLVQHINRHLMQMKRIRLEFKN
jgi:hypothetical protein